jgi:group II intron reverse transcriptase/maturase
MPCEANAGHLKGLTLIRKDKGRQDTKHRIGQVMETKLSLISEIAAKDKKCRFNTLIHLLNVENLSECFYQLKRGKAAGIDKVTIEEYESNLKSNLENLVGRMKRWQYRPQAVRRTYIPKENGKTRPLGIPCIEDKIVQKGVARILTAIYEQDFMHYSYGFRVNRSCHDALAYLDKVITRNAINWIIDADIKGFFDNVDHKWLIKCLEQRIADKNLLRLIVRILKSGVMEEGKWYKTDRGTPQGGIVSPVLANIYLHYILDLWFTVEVQERVKGTVKLVRYADDFIICIQHKTEALEIRQQLEKRLEKFDLELSPEKTRVVEFGRKTIGNARNRGVSSTTFDFLGFTHYSGKTRKGKFKVGRTTSRKRLRSKLKSMKMWLLSVKNKQPMKEWWPTLIRKLRGHFQYYGVSGNYKSIALYLYCTLKLVYKWINRRSQKRSMNWDQFNTYLKRYPLPKPRIYCNLYALSSYRSEY